MSFRILLLCSLVLIPCISQAQLRILDYNVGAASASSFGPRPGMLTAVENGGAGTVSRRSKMAAHNRAVLWEETIGATAPITPPFRERHRSAQRHGDLERDTP